MHCKSVCLQQGWYIETMKVAPGETFTIDDNWETAVFDCEGDTYVLIIDVPWEEPVRKEYDDQIQFGEGKYKLHEDGKTFEVLEYWNSFF